MLDALAPIGVVGQLPRMQVGRQGAAGRSGVQPVEQRRRGADQPAVAAQVPGRAVLCPSQLRRLADALALEITHRIVGIFG